MIAGPRSRRRDMVQSILYRSAALVVPLLAGSAATAANNTWDGGGATANWSDAVNWVGNANVPGAVDTATFNAAIANGWGSAGTPILLDADTPISTILFTLAAGDFVLGTTAGNSLLLNSGGTIVISDLATNASITETINAPMVVQGTNGTFTFNNGKNANTSKLILGGAISGGAAGNTVITFNSKQAAAPNVASGVISNGLATSLSLVHSTGTWTYSGNNSYTGSTTIQAGNANFTGDNSITGPVFVSGGAFLSLGTAAVGTGSMTGVSQITVSTATLTLNSTAGNANRIGDTATVNLSGLGTLVITGNATTNTSETIGTLALGRGRSLITMNTATGRVTTLSAGSLSRSEFGTALFRATNLNGSTTTNTTRIFLGTAPTGSELVGTGGSPTAVGSVKNLGIIPWVTGDTAAGGGGNSFLTYDSNNGLRVLATAETQTTIGAAVAPGAGATGDNVKLSGSETGIAGKTINSLFTLPGAALAVTGSGAGNSLTVSSGAIASSGGFDTNLSGFDAISFGNGEAVVSPMSTTGTITLNSTVSVGGSGHFTKGGSGTVVLNAANQYSGRTTVNLGTLQLGGSGDLGNSSGLFVYTGAKLNYNRAANYTLPTASGGGDINNNNAAATLTFNQVGTGLVLNGVSGVAGSTVVFTGTGVTSIGNPASTVPQSMTVAGQNFRFSSGTVNLTDGGRGFQSNIEINGGILNMVNSTFSMALSTPGAPQSLSISSGELNVSGGFGVKGLNTNSGSGASGPGVANVFTGVQTGGTFRITSPNFTSATWELGSVTTGASSTYSLSGGELLMLSAGKFGLGADTAGSSSTTFNFSGGKLVVASGNQAGLGITGVQGAGAKQAFVWTGGTLATYQYEAANLTSTAGQAVVAGVTNTLVNAGGTLAPGDLGTTGRTIVNGGHYSVTSPNAALAIDINGTSASGAFQDTLGGRFDYLSANSGTVSLGGKLQVSLIGGFTPTNANTFKIITSGAGGVSGTFNNTVAASTASGGGARTVLDDGLASLKVTYNATDVTLGSYVAENQWSGVSESDWSTTNNWTAFTPSQASHFAKFADAPAAAGAIDANLDTNQTVRGLIFDSATRQYTVASNNASGLTLDNGASATTVTVAGQHAVNVPITLASNLQVAVTGAGDSLTLGGAIGGAGKSLTKSGLGTLNLATANSYTGGTTISAGTLSVDAAGSLGTGSVVVASGATVQLAAGLAIDDGAVLDLDGMAALNFTGSEIVGSLVINGSAMSGGTYGSTASDAQFKDDTYFSGVGTISISAVPEPASLSVLGLGAMAMLRRRRRSAM